ncbi:hypothetical protein [Micromonospora sp. DT233]|uniref:hypothetical protein n=1 Tax=Micromonospora sp. DT233 TaxID=3393432 RepID=UPI003CEC5D12
MEEHPPAYPGGPCLACREPWPCVPRRAAMLKEFAKAPNEALTYDGWTWLDGYVLDRRGDAIARRSLFVMSAGLRWLNQPVGNRPVLPRSRARAG